MVLTTGDPKWVSRWTSLADNSGPNSREIDISSHMDLSGNSKTF